MKSPIAIAFDLDDTLYSERDYATQCLLHVARVCADRFDANGPELAKKMIDAANPYDALCDYGLGDKLPIEEFLQIYRATAPSYLPLRDDASELLNHLKSHNPEISLYLITDGRSVGQGNKIAALNLKEWFDTSHIIISEEIGYDKTTPIPFITAMWRENAQRKWIYVGDNIAKDFRWPNLLDWISIQLRDTTGRNVHPQPDPSTYAEEYRPKIIIDNLNQIIEYIKICQ
jgi:putative hydrolase of the HAD superfamily